MSLLRLSKLACAPWGSPLLQDIDLELQSGEIHGLIGSNGAGKSTLLRCISGEVPTAAGQLQLLGRPLSDWQALEKARHLALLPQQSPLNFPFCVSEVVALGRTPHASGKQRDKKIALEAMDALDINHMSQRLYTQLSGGEKQRVQIARIVAQVWQASEHQERLLLLDEPTTALDLSHQQLFVELLRNMRERSCGVVLVLHDFNLLASVADRITALHNGRILIQDEPGRVFTPEVFRQAFGCEVHIMDHPAHHYPMVIQP